MGRVLDDGLVELRSAADALAHLPLEQMCDRLLDRMLPDRLDDDVALLAVRLRGAGPGQPAE